MYYGELEISCAFARLVRTVIYGYSLVYTIKRQRQTRLILCKRIEQVSSSALFQPLQASTDTAALGQGHATSASACLGVLA